MAGRAVTLDGLRRSIFAANPHLDTGRDTRAVERLAMVYSLTEAFHALIAKSHEDDTNAPSLDELHKLYADALRLEQELGITPAARQRQGFAVPSAPKAGGLSGAKG